jgi:site-specific DNA recombinase
MLVEYIFQYHCNICKKERFKARLANDSIEGFLGKLEFNSAAKTVYKDMLALLNATEPDAPKVDLKSVEAKISQVRLKIDKLQDFLIDGIIQQDAYQRKHPQLIAELTQLEEQKGSTKSNKGEAKTKLERGINFLINAKDTYKQASIIDKQRLISSIFPEKLEFANNKCRTFRMNDLLSLMSLNNSDLQEKNTGQIDTFIDLSPQVDLNILLSNFKVSDLDLFPI